MSVYLIAEIGSVHDGSFGNAQCLIDAAAQAGADAVKFQTHIAGAETTRDAPAPPYFTGEPRFEYFQRTGFTLPQWKALKQRCRERNVDFLSSPFSLEAVELLEQAGVAQYKIPSGEVTNLPLLERIARTGKPVILSSGMNSWEELDAAVAALEPARERLTLLQCTSEYPCPYERVGLNVMLEMRERYGVPVGLSDHTLTSYATLAAVTLGATVIERHFTLSRKMYGSDAKHSMEPHEFQDLANGIRAIATMLAHPVSKDDLSRLGDMKRIFQKSVVAAVDIPAGAIISLDLLAFKKPGTGISASRHRELLGRRAARFVPADSLLGWDDMEALADQPLRKAG